MVKTTTRTATNTTKGNTMISTIARKLTAEARLMANSGEQGFAVVPSTARDPKAGPRFPAVKVPVSSIDGRPFHAVAVKIARALRAARVDQAMIREMNSDILQAEWTRAGLRAAAETWVTVVEKNSEKFQENA